MHPYTGKHRRRPLPEDLPPILRGLADLITLTDTPREDTP